MFVVYSFARLGGSVKFYKSILCVWLVCIDLIWFEICLCGGVSS